MLYYFVIGLVDVGCASHTEYHKTHRHTRKIAYLSSTAMYPSVSISHPTEELYDELALILTMFISQLWKKRRASGSFLDQPETRVTESYVQTLQGRLQGKCCGVRYNQQRRLY